MSLQRHHRSTPTAAGHRDHLVLNEVVSRTVDVESGPGPRQAESHSQSVSPHHGGSRSRSHRSAGPTWCASLDRGRNAARQTRSRVTAIAASRPDGLGRVVMVTASSDTADIRATQSIGDIMRGRDSAAPQAVMGGVRWCEAPRQGTRQVVREGSKSQPKGGESGLGRCIDRPRGRASRTP